MSWRSSESGQASVEFTALLPLIAVAAAALVWVALIGHAVWAADQAAQAAARAQAVGGDPRRAALGALPDHLEHRLRVSSRPGGGVVLVLQLPVLVPGLSLGALTVDARFAPQA